jgi:hypothetical protein
MKRNPKQHRACATETLSVSIDPETKAALHALAGSDFGGNMSALITELAGDARRRMAAGAYLRRHGLPDPTPVRLEAIQAEIDVEIAAWRNRKSKKRRPKLAQARGNLVTPASCAQNRSPPTRKANRPARRRVDRKRKPSILCTCVGVGRSTRADEREQER